MKFWPFKTISAARYAELVDAESALTVALGETTAVEKARDMLRAQRDAALEDNRQLSMELEELRRRLDLAEHGEGSIAVLLDNGRAISAHRTSGGAKRAARESCGIDETLWSGNGEGRSLTDCWVISTIPLAADTPADHTPRKAVQA
ncbi:hypothetical protein [Streptomyces sp. SPB4]|uniref:hypothetical protein n=1 Tax=Streptomyces sp. SPB4 TaxID=2940553 RepID=UPI0024742381|nr:hypothetical protein [Streptomyces sp. SPB4]MDH6545879.1 hypothetical protein [Streptomyces sp. SPB4]